MSADREQLIQLFEAKVQSFEAPVGAGFPALLPFKEGSRVLLPASARCASFANHGGSFRIVRVLHARASRRRTKSEGHRPIPGAFVDARGFLPQLAHHGRHGLRHHLAALPGLQKRAGFPISIHKFDVRANLTIHGKNSYNANVSDSALGAIASVEHALESMEDQLRERESGLKQYRKQSEDLTRQLDHPFEHQEKLTAATKRQQEIVAALDITKNQTSAKVDEGIDQAVETIEEKSQQAPRRRIVASIGG
jgi:hypothetical protein